MTGVKYDSGKPRWSLLPTDILWGAVKVMEVGARKYSPNNWMHVPDGVCRYSDAAARHLDAIERGEDNDPESGLPHAWHYLCSAIFVAWKILNRPEELRAWRERGAVVIPVESKAPWAQIEQLETEPAPGAVTFVKGLTANELKAQLDADKHEHVWELCDSKTHQRVWRCRCGHFVEHNLNTNGYFRSFGTPELKRFTTYFEAVRANPT